MAALVGARVFVASAQAFAGEAAVVDVALDANGQGRFTIRTTVRHDDSGWDHYANRWVVLGKDGSILAERILLHPHEDEQPFTRSLSGVRIPAGDSEVYVQAFDSVHGAGAKFGPVPVPGR